jgi:hypothetical protein
MGNNKNQKQVKEKRVDAEKPLDIVIREKIM